MKNYQMLIFFLIVFSVYFGANTYIFYKGYNLFSKGNYTLVYTISFIFMASLFIAGKMLERNHSGILSDALNIFGGFWLAYMLYTFLFYIVTDAGFAAARLAGVIDKETAGRFTYYRFIVVNALTVIIIVVGFINALSPVVSRYEVTIPKQAGGKSEFTIAAVSDIHLGSTIRKRSMRKLQGIIKSEHPDMVLFLGDIVDGEIGPVLRGDLLASFSCPPCMDGVYGITGNHEYIGGIDKTVPYIRSRGINLLEDEVVVTPSGFTLIGRKDRDSFRYSGIPRSSLGDLVSRADPNTPIILMDHQPFNPGESAANGIDIQLSGHTHNGQIWPVSLLVKRLYEIPYGYRKIDNTHIIVSSGFGLWGPRVRIGSRPEVVIVNVRLESGNQTSE